MDDTKPIVWLHSDAVIDCDCGDRVWDVQTPRGYMWSTPEGPGDFQTLDAAMTYAASLHEDHPDVAPLPKPTDSETESDAT